MTLMRTLNDITVIDIVWEGPLTLTEVEKNCHGDADYGIYQVYGGKISYFTSDARGTANSAFASLGFTNGQTGKENLSKFIWAA
jgi:hypothetical protein